MKVTREEVEGHYQVHYWTSLKCDHKRTKRKMVAWDSTCRYGRQQGFMYIECCARCGSIVKPNRENVKNESN